MCEVIETLESDKAKVIEVFKAFCDCRLDGKLHSEYGSFGHYLDYHQFVFNTWITCDDAENGFHAYMTETQAQKWGKSHIFDYNSSKKVIVKKVQFRNIIGYGEKNQYGCPVMAIEMFIPE